MGQPVSLHRHIERRYSFRQAKRVAVALLHGLLSFTLFSGAAKKSCLLSNSCRFLFRGAVRNSYLLPNSHDSLFRG